MNTRRISYRALVVLAVAWPLIVISFVKGLLLKGPEVGVNQSLYLALKPAGVISMMIASYWLVRELIDGQPR